MSIASEITRINGNISSAYTACSNKGATMPATQNSANLATTVTSIPTGDSKSMHWILNQQSTSSVGETITITTNDDWIKQNYNSGSLVITLFILDTPTLANQSLYGIIQKNSLYYSTNYGRSIRTAISSTSWVDNHFAHAISDTTTTPKMGFLAYSNGTLELVVRDAGVQLYLQSGKYMITASVE